MKYVKINNIATHRLAMSVECSGCGIDLSGREKFCPNCGTKLQRKKMVIFEDLILAILNSQEELNKTDGEEDLPSASGTAEMPTKEDKDSKVSTFVGDVKVGSDSVSANPEGHQELSGETPCFTAGHKILMGNGEKKNIEDILDGEVVFTHKGCEKSVVRIGLKTAAVWLMAMKDKIKFSVTPNHPFFGYISGETTLGWLSVDDIFGALKMHKKVMLAKWNPFAIKENYEFVEVDYIVQENRLETVYNLEVEGDHSYICNGYCVHNCSTSESEKAHPNKGAPRCLRNGEPCAATCPHRSPKGACTAIVCTSIPPQYHMCPKWGSGFVFCSEA